MVGRGRDLLILFSLWVNWFSLELLLVNTVVLNSTLERPHNRGTGLRGPGRPPRLVPADATRQFSQQLGILRPHVLAT